MTSTLTEDEIVTFLGVVHPWECDSMGHWNAAFYARIFDDANAVTMHHLGYSVLGGIEASVGWADVRLEIEYRAEVRANCVIRVSSAIVAVGRTSLTIEHKLHDETQGRIAAVARSRPVCFDLVGRRARPLPEDLRETVARRIASRVVAHPPQEGGN